MARVCGDGKIMWDGHHKGSEPGCSETSELGNETSNKIADISKHDPSDEVLQIGDGNDHEAVKPDSVIADGDKITLDINKHSLKQWQAGNVLPEMENLSVSKPMPRSVEMAFTKEWFPKDNKYRGLDQHKYLMRAERFHLASAPPDYLDESYGELVSGSKAEVDPNLYHGPEAEVDPDLDRGPEAEMEPDLDREPEAEADPNLDRRPEAKAEPDLDCGQEAEVDLDRGQAEVDSSLCFELESEMDSYLDCELESEVDFDLDCELETEVDRVKKYGFDELKAKALHIVRLYEVTEYDPVHCIPVCTCFCKYSLAYFDFDKESKVVCGKPFLELRSSQHNLLEESVNMVSLRILESDVGYPVSVFGTVLVRDQLDYKCVFLFRRDTDDPQVINSPKDSLTLTDPCRGLALTSSMFFEINLKIKGDSGDATTFSKGVIEHDTCVSAGEKLMEKPLSSWHSTVQLAYTPVPFAVIATLSVSMLHGACDFTGEIIAWTSRNENKIILHDSKVAGTSTELGAGGSVPLSRRLVAVPVDEELMLRICVLDAAAEAACLELSLGHFDDHRTCFLNSYKLQVDVEWTGILNTMREDVFEYVGDTKLLL